MSSPDEPERTCGSDGLVDTPHPFSRRRSQCRRDSPRRVETLLLVFEIHTHLDSDVHSKKYTHILCFLFGLG